MIANDSYIVFEINAYDGFTAIGGSRRSRFRQFKKSKSSG